MSKAVITFGRLNPPTIGHQKLVDKVKSEAKKRGAMPHVYLSHSQDKKKNPLDYDTKVRIAKKAFGPSITKSKARNIIEVLKELEKMGHTEVTIVVGSDRVKEFDTLTSKYNGKEYNFDKIGVVSAGDRDPDAEGVTGMSASKMRAVAQAGDYDLFKKGTPTSMSEKDKKFMYDKIRSEMGISEEKEIEADEGDFEFTDAELERFIDVIDIDSLDEEGELDEEFEEFLEEVLLERKPLTVQQRMAIGRRMKRLQPRIKRRREMLKKRMATSSKLETRARKAAIKLLRKKFAGKQGQNYASLSPSSKISVDRIIQKKMAMVGKISKRLLPKIRKAEQERLKKARSAKNESVDINEKFTQSDVDGLEKFADRILKKYDIDVEFTRHFVDRLNDPRNNPDIKVAELQRFFKKIQKNKGKNIRQNPDVQVVLKDLASDINLPVVINYKDGKFEVVNKTVMRKKDFKTPNKVFKYEEFDINIAFESYLNENRSSQQYIFEEEDDQTNVKLMNILRQAFRDPTERQLVIRSLKGGEKTLSNPKLRPFILKLLNRLLDAAQQDPAIYNKMRDKLRRMGQDDEMKEAQDPDIKDRPGSQPAGYHKGLKKSTKVARDRHFKKYADKSDSDPSNYKPAPGDKGAKTKPSVHTQKYKAMYGEDLDAAFEKFISEEYIEEKALEGLKKKAEKSGIPYSILKKVYDRGMAAWKSGHRPGTTPQQWAYARVNSFITGGKTRQTADADLWKGRKEEVSEQDAVKATKERIKREKQADKVKHDAMLDRARLRDTQAKNRAESVDAQFESFLSEGFVAGIPDTMYAKDFEEHKVHGGFALHPSVMEQGGAGEEGTDKLVKKYKKDTPGEICEAIEFMEKNEILFSENIYRPLSEKYFEFFREARQLMNEGVIEVTGANRQILETDIGEFDIYEGEEVPLDCPLVEENEKTPELNKPKRGGPKKFYVYVRDPQTKNIKKVTFGDTTGLKAKINNPAARKSFAARHQCDTRNDKTTASYWACRLPRYAASLGMQVDNPGAFW